MLTLFPQCSSDEQTAMACFDRLLHESIQANTMHGSVYSSSASDVLLDIVVTVIRDVRCCVAMHVQYMLQLY